MRVPAGATPRVVLAHLTLLALLTLTAAAGGEARVYTGTDAMNAPEGSTVEVSGRVRRVGSQLFSDLVVTDAAGNDWYIVSADDAALRRLEQEQATVRGTLHLRDMVLADGRQLGARRELTDVVVVDRPD